MTGRTRTIALAMTGLIAVGGAAACGSSSSGGSTNTAPAPASTPSAESTPSASPTPLAAIPSLTGVHTQVILDAGFAKALKSLKVTPGLIGNAGLNAKTGTLTFPITGGNVTYYKPGTVSPYVTGLIKHQGSGFTLTAGGIKVGLSNFVVNPGTSMLTGKVTATAKGKTTTVFKSGAPLFSLDGSSLEPLKMGKNSTAILYGTKVYLTSTAAKLLSKTYSLPSGTLSGKTLVGIAKITVKVPTS